MPRTDTLREGETLEQLARRLGISVDDLLGMNPGLTTEGLVAGLQLTIPDAAATSVAAAPAPETFPAVPTPTPVTSTPEAPTGMLAGGGAQGLFEEMLKDFRKAFQTFLSAPGFIQNMDTAVRGRGQAAAQPGWTRQEAEFLRANEEEFATRYEEQVQRQFAETGELPSLTPEQFLRTVKPRTEMEMRTSETRGGRPRVPSVGVRRLRF